jgi:hypothetical protein
MSLCVWSLVDVDLADEDRFAMVPPEEPAIVDLEAGAVPVSGPSVLAAALLRRPAAGRRAPEKGLPPDRVWLYEARCSATNWARLIPITAPVAAGGRRGLLDGVRAVHVLLGIEAYIDDAWLKVVDASSMEEGVAEEAVIGARTELHERGGVLEVTGVAELDSRRALEGVVARVADIEPYIHIPALGFLLDI